MSWLVLGSHCVCNICGYGRLVPKMTCAQCSQLSRSDRVAGWNMSLLYNFEIWWLNYFRFNPLHFTIKIIFMITFSSFYIMHALCSSDVNWTIFQMSRPPLFGSCWNSIENNLFLHTQTLEKRKICGSYQSRLSDR